jgi:hypothetical protein
MTEALFDIPVCHSRVSGNPAFLHECLWVPAFAGTTERGNPLRKPQQ